MDGGRRDEARHADAAVEEWVFACWSTDGSLGAISGHRLLGRTAWYWAALVGVDRPLLHVAEWDVAVRADPMVVKAEVLWAEHTCDAPFEQWTIGNETFAVELDDPEQALGRAYGARRPIAFDLEWYATSPPTAVPGGYEQVGSVHGRIDLVNEPAGPEGIDLEELYGRRWHRWGERLDPIVLDDARAHTGLRAPFAFPDGTVADWVLTPSGWRSRRRAGSPDRRWADPSPGAPVDAG